MKRSQISEGDLLVKITGVGRMAVASVVPENFVGNINQHVCVIKTGSKEISETLAAFLNTDIGEKLASRRATGGTRPALDYPALLSIPIIEDNRILEITKKVVEQKKANEAEAERLLAGIDDYLLNELGIKLPEPPENTLSNRIFTTSIQKISGKRFDPKLYSMYSVDLINSLYSTCFSYKSLKSLIIHNCAGDWGTDTKDEFDNESFVKCLVIRATEFDNKFNLNVDGNRAKYRLINRNKYKALDIQTNDLLLEKSGGSENQPVGRISILSDDLTSNYSLGFSNFVQKLRLDINEVVPEFVFNFLKTIHNIKITDIMQSQTNGIRNLILSEYYSLPIPIPKKEKQQEIADHITDIRKQAKDLKNMTIDLLATASKEIEKILIG